MKSPAVNFYTSDFLTGTTFMTNKSVGAYIRILSYQHQLGHLKKEYILSIMNDLNEEEKITVLEKFITDKKGMYFNQRMEKEIISKEKYAESRGKNRKKNSEDMKNISNSYEEHMEDEVEIENIKEIINEFNNIKELSKVSKLSKTRKEKLNLRLKEIGYKNFIEVIKKIPKSKFLLGDNDRKWKLDFDWLIANDTNILKVLEGKYETKNINKSEEEKFLNE